MHSLLEMLLQLGLSAVLGLVIGLERELKRKPVGIKTCIVISIISCLLTIVSIESAYQFPVETQIRMDPLRLAAQIVSGIGFIGAGVILKRGNDSILGLTTAAMIWGAAGIGIAVGAGFYIEAFSCVGLLIISVELIPLLIRLIGPKKLREKEINLKLIVSTYEFIPGVIRQIRNLDVSIKSIKLKDLETSQHLIQMIISVSPERKITDVYYQLHSLQHIKGLEIEMM